MQSRGAEQEALAERILAQQGYVVIERNWRGGGGEVDRIAWNNDILCFIEVRSKVGAAGGAPEESVDWRKRRRLIRAARAYLMRFAPGQEPSARFDVVGITLAPSDQRPSWVVIENAFDERGRPS